MFKVIAWMMDWYSIYSFLFITIFVLFSFSAIPNLKEKQLYREATWLKRGLIITLFLDNLLFFAPRIALFFLLS